jgi:DNA-binding Xre family transcriptional regulator
MAKYKQSDFRPFSELLEQFSEEERREIAENARAILESSRLANLRKALDVTQKSLAEKTGIKQAELSRIENNIETVQIKTLDRYVTGLGGSCKIVAEFPDGTVAEIPLRAGKPVKSRVTVGSRRGPSGKLDIAS